MMFLNEREDLPVDTRDIYDHINHVTAQLVGLHINRGATEQSANNGKGREREKSLTCQWLCRSYSQHQTKMLSQFLNSVNNR